MPMVLDLMTCGKCENTQWNVSTVLFFCGMSLILVVLLKVGVDVIMSRTFKDQPELVRALQDKKPIILKERNERYVGSHASHLAEDIYKGHVDEKYLIDDHDEVMMNDRKCGKHPYVEDYSVDNGEMRRIVQQANGSNWEGDDTWEV